MFWLGIGQALLIRHKDLSIYAPTAQDMLGHPIWVLPHHFQERTAHISKAHLMQG
jgi:hypothetical protein